MLLLNLCLILPFKILNVALLWQGMQQGNKVKCMFELCIQYVREVLWVQSIRNKPSKTECYNRISLNMLIFCHVFKAISSTLSHSSVLDMDSFCIECLFSELFIFLHFTVSRQRKWVHFLEAPTNTNRDLRKWKLSHHKLIMSLYKFYCKLVFLPSSLEFIVSWGVAGPAHWQHDPIKVLDGANQSREACTFACTFKLMFYIRDS